MLKGLHSILRNIQGGKVGTVETPFRLLCTVYSNSSIIENKMHTEAVCVCVLVLPTTSNQKKLGQYGKHK